MGQGLGWPGCDERWLGDKSYFAGNGIHLRLADVAVGGTLAWLALRFPKLDRQSKPPAWRNC